jgi:hypothetical protein
MSADFDKLNDLIEDLPDTIAQLDVSLDKIGDQIEFLGEDQAGVEHVMSMMTTAASGWMYIKADELGFNKASVITSGSWGVDNLIEWAILSAGPGTKVFSWGEVVSGAPAEIETQHYNRQLDFPEAYLHLNQDLGLDGTYGILDKIVKLEVAETLQALNRTKFTRFLKAYERNSIL